jgi:hypothetical protein
MFKHLINHPAYIFKFAIYILFVFFAVVFYVSDIMGEQDKSLKTIYSVLLFFYGSYRLIRTYQDFKTEIRGEE